MRPRLFLYFAKSLSSRSWQSFISSKMSHLIFFSKHSSILKLYIFVAMNGGDKMEVSLFFSFVLNASLSRGEACLWIVCVRCHYRLKVETRRRPALSPLSPLCPLRTTLWALFISPCSWDHSRVWASSSLRSKKGGHASFPHWRQRHAGKYACPKHSKKQKNWWIRSLLFSEGNNDFYCIYLLEAPYTQRNGIQTAVLIAGRMMQPLEYKLSIELPLVAKIWIRLKAGSLESIL